MGEPKKKKVFGRRDMRESEYGYMPLLSYGRKQNVREEHQRDTQYGGVAE